jgi:dihydropyrimidinase
MSDHDLVIKGGTIVTPADMFRSDIGIANGRVQAIGLGLRGARTLDADGMLVMPGGVDTHCHIEQLRADGTTDEETFVTGSTSALAGGTTSVITFSIQFKGQGISAPLAEYRRLAAASMVD